MINELIIHIFINNYKLVLSVQIVRKKHGAGGQTINWALSVDKLTTSNELVLKVAFVQVNDQMDFFRR
jgi:hypothetical protein